MSRPLIWKHNCEECETPCDDPWQVDMPRPSGCATFATQGETFATWGEALDWALEQIK
jgi:hypothetical protein